MNLQLWLPLAATLIIMGTIFFVAKERPAATVEPGDALAGDPEAPVAQEEDSKGGEGWRNIGSLFIVLGGLGMALSLFMKTSVETVGLYGASDVVNLGLMFNKGVSIAVSLFAIGLGVFCVAVGAIVRAIARQSWADSAPTADLSPS